MRNIAFILALACVSLGAGNIVEAKCPPGDGKCSSETSDDEALLQSRTAVEEQAEDSMEDSVVEEMENEETDMGLEEMDDSEEDIGDMEEIDGLDWRSMLTEEGAAFLQQEEDSMEDEFPEIKDEAAEIEDTADEVEEGEVEEDRGGKGWKRVKKWAKKARKAIPSFRTLWSQCTRSVRGMDLVSGCSSLNSCKKAFFKGPKKLMNKIAQEGAKVINSATRSGELGRAFRAVNGALRQARTMVRQTKSQANSMARGFSDVLKGAKRAIRNTRLNMCTPRGLGYWSFKGSDCGAFSRLGNVLRGRGSISDVIRRFGQCAAKRAFKIFWTPFIDVSIKSWCVPSFIRKPIEGLVGSIQYAVSRGQRSGVFGTIVNGIKSVGNKMKKLFQKMQFLEVVGSTIHNDTSQYSIDSDAPRCHGSDFSASISLGGGFTWKSGNGLGIALTFSQGCLKHKYFADFSFGLAGSMWVAGVPMDPADAGFGGGVTLGFNVGRGSRAVISWGASVDFTGEATVFGVDGSLGLGFDVLPGPGAPSGFSVTPKFLTALNEVRQQEIDSALAQHDNDEDKLYAGFGTLLQQFDNLDLSDAESGAAMSAMQVGATAMKENEESGAWPIKDISESAGLAIDFCLTCIMRDPIY